MHDQMEVEVFRAGEYGPKGSWGEAELDQIADDYDPAVHEAPVTLDHAQRGPALGWVAALRRVGDRLVARLRGLNRRLMDSIREGAFKKRSVELYSSLRETERPYLRAVSFLGASVPEVKGLADPLLPEADSSPLFSDDEEGVVSLKEEDRVSGFGSRSPTRHSRFGDGAVSGGDQTATEKLIDDEPSETPALSFPETRQAFSDLVTRLQSDGRWHPAWRERGIEEFYRALAGIGEVEINENESIDVAEWFARFLEELPPIVMMNEAAPPDATRFRESAPTEEAIRGGANIDPASMTLHRSVLAYREAHPSVSYAEALMRCGAGGRF